jgi:endonuclease-3
VLPARQSAAAAETPTQRVRRARRMGRALAEAYPDAHCELDFTNPLELLVATILSAQSTDKRVNSVTRTLFARYPDAAAYAAANREELEQLIMPTGFFRAKTDTLIKLGAALVERFDGEVPHRMADLVTLPGVGRKTANVVLGHALGVPGLPVDRHVLRVANRIGIAEGDDPIVVEQQLCGALPPERWTRTSDTLILHGRRICKPKPLCDQCFVVDDCDYYRLVVSRERSTKPKLKLKLKTQKRKLKTVGKKPVRKARR